MGGEGSYGYVGGCPIPSHMHIKHDKQMPPRWQPFAISIHVYMCVCACACMHMSGDTPHVPRHPTHLSPPPELQGAQNTKIQ